jgi:hypothetical protein
LKSSFSLSLNFELRHTSATLPSTLILFRFITFSQIVSEAQMAVIEGVDGIEVQVICDRQPLQEYHDPDVEEVPLTATRYVEAKTGKAFAVRCQIKKHVLFRGNHISCAVIVDGIHVKTPMITKDFPTMETFRVIDGAPISSDRQVPLLFSDLSISEISFMHVGRAESTLLTDGQYRKATRAPKIRRDTRILVSSKFA